MKSKFPCPFIFLFFLLQGLVFGQQQEAKTYSFDFRGELLTDVLDQIAHTADLDLVYDPALVRRVQVYERFRNETVENLLKELLKKRHLDYITLSSGTFVIVRTAEGDPGYGTLTGRIVDSETGEPLPGATVMLADASGGTSTNRAGAFSMNRMLSGSYSIIFSYIGYEPVYKTINIPPDREVREKILLEQKPVDVLPVVIESHNPAMPHRRTGSSVSTDRNWEPAGATKDAIRNLSLSPGVQYGLPMSDLHLQGGQRSEHRILLDGVPVYNPYSFGQMFSSFSPFAIGKIHLYKAGYDVQQGSQIAGLVNLQHDVPISEKKESAIVQTDPLSMNLRGDLNFSMGENKSPLHIMSAFRTNFWNIYKDPALERTLRDWNFIDPLIASMTGESGYDMAVYNPVLQESDVQFYDLHFAAGYEPDDYNTLSASFYRGENSVGAELLSQAASGVAPPYLFTRDKHQWENVMGQVSWNSILSPRFDFSAQASFSANRFSHQNVRGTDISPIYPGNLSFVSAELEDYNSSTRWLPGRIDGNRIQHFIFRSDGSYSINRRFKINAGVQTDFLSSEVDVSDLTHQQGTIGQSSILFSSFINGNYTFGSYWNIEGGSRLTTLNTGDKVYAEPRLSVQYDRQESGIGYWSARLAGGIYRQFIHQYDITNTGPASLVPEFTIWSHGIESESSKAYHVSGSFFLEPSENTSLKLESFIKHQPDTYITSYGYHLAEGKDKRNSVGAFAETTEMTTLGAGIRVNQELAQSRLKLIAGYDYNFSRLDLRTQFGRRLPAPWNEPHRVQFRALGRLLPDFTLAAKWQGVWGRAWAFRQSYYHFLRFQNPDRHDGYTFKNPGKDILSPFHQVDLSIIYQPSLSFSDIEVRLELINLLNRKNALDQTLFPTGNPDEPFEIHRRTLPGFYPSASVQVKF